MLALLVDLHIRGETRDAFVAAIRTQAEASLEAELGCERFDVCEDIDDPDHFVLYEVYEDEIAYKAHRETGHFARWTEARNAYVVEMKRTVARIL
jgi:quinol monooxygenase YgiN